METYKLAVFVCFVIFNYSEANQDFKRNSTSSPKLIRPSEATIKRIISVYYDCFENSRKVPCYLKKGRSGEYFCSRTYKEGMCCVYSQSGYVDETTGLFDEETFGLVYPKECKALELVQYCQRMVKKNKNAKEPCDVIFETHKCIVGKGKCAMDVMPKGM